MSTLPTMRDRVETYGGDSIAISTVVACKPGECRPARRLVGWLLVLAGPAACAGGPSGDAESSGLGGESSGLGGENSRAAEAAVLTANSDDNACSTNRPFYWEVGDRNGRLTGGSVSAAGSAEIIAADTKMTIASASKWLYSSYVAERRDGKLTDDDVRYLTLTSGYDSFRVCLPSQTVGTCMAFASNGDYTEEADGLFYYGGGHMQRHAELNGLADMDALALGVEIGAGLGGGIALSYALPELAGGAEISPAEYAKFLRQLLTGELHMGSLLGSHAVCTSLATCPTEALSTAAPDDETWHYSLGHWVEDDPAVGDGAFSSLGLFGFYPWIDSSASWYGIVASHDVTAAPVSLACGRLIRQAWVTATEAP